MLKIMETHPTENAQSEYIVLQNLGLTTINLRGWAICTEAYLEGSAAQRDAEMYVFREDVSIKPYMRVVLFTGRGENEWVPTTDGKRAYCAYWNRAQSVWTNAQNVHVLKIAATQRVVPPGVETPVARPSSAAALEAIVENETPVWKEGYAVVSAPRILQQSPAS